MIPLHQVPLFNLKGRTIRSNYYAAKLSPLKQSLRDCSGDQCRLRRHDLALFLGFLMRCVLPAPLAKFLHLDLSFNLLLILAAKVIYPLANSALKLY